MTTSEKHDATRAMCPQCNRRDILRLAGAICLAPFVGAASAERKYTLLWVAPFGGPPPSVKNRAALMNALANRGYVEGVNLELMVADPWTPGNDDQREASLARAIARGPDAIVALTTSGARRVQRATSTIPIVFWDVADPVAAGLVKSIRHPGGNITGVSVHNLSLFPKRLQLIRDISPLARRLALVIDSAFVGDGFPPAFYREMGEVATGLKFDVVEVDMAVRPAVPGGILDDVQRVRPDFVLPLGPWPSRDIPSVEWARFQSRHRIPVFGIGSIRRGDALDDLLIQYGVRLDETFPLVADQLARIFSGVNPGGIPVQQQTRVELVINMKAARHLGMTVPKDLLLRADRVIE